MGRPGREQHSEGPATQTIRLFGIRLFSVVDRFSKQLRITESRNCKEKITNSKQKLELIAMSSRGLSTKLFLCVFL